MNLINLMDNVPILIGSCYYCTTFQSFFKTHIHLNLIIAIQFILVKQVVNQAKKTKAIEMENK